MVETEHEWFELWPDGANDPAWSHSGIALLGDGRVVFGHPAGGALILLDERTGRVDSIELPTLAIHGIFAESVDGSDVLWLADTGARADPATGYGPIRAPGQVLRLTLSSGDTELIDQPATAYYLDATWRPTSVAKYGGDGPFSRSLWVADGYGQSLVHRVGNDGLLLSGPGSGDRFDCPHGIAVDDRRESPELVVADRGNRRLVWFDLDGKFLRTLEHRLLRSPSSIARHGDDLLVTELDGGLLAVDQRDRVRNVIATPQSSKREGWPNELSSEGPVRPPLHVGTLNSPHGLAVGANGDIYLTEWLIGGRQLRLSARGK